MARFNKTTYWMIWLALATGLCSYLAAALVGADKALYLPGQTSHGHYQIELQCGVCHQEGFVGIDGLQEACVECHGQELKLADDKHPRSKFTDPRNADRLAMLDARYCITCHSEHQAERTMKMGVTLPEDFCYLCHKEIANERPSHQGMAFTSCDDAGCHNYHDNRALYEDFLLKNASEPALLQVSHVPERNYRKVYESSGHTLGTPLAIAQHDWPAGQAVEQKVLQQWHDSTHAQAGVNCSACHYYSEEAESQKTWHAHPGLAGCHACHASEVEGFTQGHHGMRLAQDLPALVVSDSSLPMQQDALLRTLGCSSCHTSHTFDTEAAAVEVCLGCHADKHSLNYKQSTHYLNGQGRVTCATCHLPRRSVSTAGVEVTQVEHNQNANLRPNEKMIREVCMNCHGLAFSIDALADRALILNNFSGWPAHAVKSVTMALDREAATIGGDNSDLNQVEEK